MSSAPLSPIEIEKLINKIRSEYNFYSKENPSIFKLITFEERYTQILKSKGNLSLFIRDELIFLEQLKKKHKEILDKKSASKGETFNKILEEQEQKISKYKRVDFHPDARNELKYFLGAMQDFVDSELILIQQIYRGTYEFNTIQEIILQLERVGLSKRGLLPIRFIEHLKLLTDSKPSITKIEQDAQQIIKEGCFGIAKLKDCIEELRNQGRINLNLNFKFNERLEPKLFNLYNNKSFESVIPLIIQKIKDIIIDFRMESIVGLK
jgi:hypothetical protein